jgi:hypothetical protein
MAHRKTTQRIHSYCCLCIARCGAVAWVQHGRFTALKPDLAIDAPGYDPFAAHGANLNLIIGSSALDPINGTASHRAYLCEIQRAEHA